MLTLTNMGTLGCNARSPKPQALNPSPQLSPTSRIVSVGLCTSLFCALLECFLRPLKQGQSPLWGCRTATFPVFGAWLSCNRAYHLCRRCSSNSRTTSRTPRAFSGAVAAIPATRPSSSTRTQATKLPRRRCLEVHGY